MAYLMSNTASLTSSCSSLCKISVEKLGGGVRRELSVLEISMNWGGEELKASIDSLEELLVRWSALVRIMLIHLSTLFAFSGRKIYKLI